MPKIQVNDIEMYYETHGKGHALMLIAGYTADTRSWALVTEQLAQHFQVILMDNRGAGDSDAPDTPYSVDLMANDLIALADALKLDKPHVFGNSMGGAIVQSIGKYHGDKVDKIIISNSSRNFNSAAGYAREDHLKIFEKNGDHVEQFHLAKPWLFSAHFLSNSQTIDQIVELIKQNPKPQTIPGRKRQAKALSDFDSRTWISDIQNECLVLTSDEDIICLAKESQAMANTLPHAKLHTIEDCGHLPMIEYPDQVVETMLDFLK